MPYEVLYSEHALKALKKMDKHQAGIIVAWIEKNLVGCTNPHLYGKALTGGLQGYWRYRIGVQRIIAEIKDAVLVIEIINAGHRKDIYEN
jgi:mRNA interferase RelE/StbE